MADLEKVTLFKDELEALKLCDFDGLTQEEVGREMGISRGTAQRILASARRKVAMCLSQGKAILFEQEN
jgi:RNA polymerase sigma factor (sigma-70 family)